MKNITHKVIIGGFFTGALWGAITAIFEVLYWFISLSLWEVISISVWWDIVRIVMIYSSLSGTLFIFLGITLHFSLRGDSNKFSLKNYMERLFSFGSFMFVSFVLLLVFWQNNILQSSYLLYFTFLAPLAGWGGIRLWRAIPTKMKKLLGIIIVIFFVSHRSVLVKNIYAQSEGGLKKPNVLLIVLDTMRADHLSAYGYDRQTSPNIDWMSNEGTLFTNAYATAPWTLPSHASLFTGLFPSQHGADGSWTRLNDSFETLAEILKDNGYKTVAISNNSYVTEKTNLDQGFDEFIYLDESKSSVRMLPSRYLEVLLITLGKENLNNSTIMNKLHRWLSLNISYDAGASATNYLAKSFFKLQVDDQEPLFLFLNYMEAHAPYGDSPEGKSYYSSIKMSHLQAKSYIEPYENYIKLLKSELVLSDFDNQVLIELYDRDISYLDKKIGELLNFLSEKELLDDTLLIITSDHGENLGDHNKVGHVLDLHSTVTKVPLIIRYPDYFFGGEKNNDYVQLVDVLPTITEVLGLNHQENIQGRSLLHKTERKQVVAEANFKEAFFSNFQKVMGNETLDEKILGGKWKSIINLEKYEYIKNPHGEFLYNLNVDPWETEDLSRTSTLIRTSLSKQLFNWIGSFEHYWNPFIR